MVCFIYNNRNVYFKLNIMVAVRLFKSLLPIPPQVQQNILSVFFKIWLRAKVSGAPVKFLTLIAMALRGIKNQLIVDARIAAFKAGFVSFWPSTSLYSSATSSAIRSPLPSSSIFANRSLACGMAGPSSTRCSF